RRRVGRTSTERLAVWSAYASTPSRPTGSSPSNATHEWRATTFASVEVPEANSSARRSAWSGQPRPPRYFVVSGSSNHGRIASTSSALSAHNRSSDIAASRRQLGGRRGMTTLVILERGLAHVDHAVLALTSREFAVRDEV